MEILQQKLVLMKVLPLQYEILQEIGTYIILAELTAHLRTHFL